MSTPRKNFNYNSPYAKPQQQYPSQSQDYISLDMGGPTKNNTNTSASDSNLNEKTPGHYNGKFYQQHNSNYKANRRHQFNNNYNQHNNRQQQFNTPQQQHHHQRFQPRHSNERQHFQQKHNHHHNHAKANNQSIEAYCHPSMLEDPWFELMQRLRSLEKSKITVKDMTPPKDSTPPPDSHSTTESDNDEVNSVASD
ncbi:protein kinase 4 [Lucilia cuprina]|uniref:protein kinase 4 n=1 Tax=Lucilia cuprina TaxID=7375 RepID=UPI001F05555E|nr:protein kinase 4 [Lucilia cuprina]